MHKQTPVAFIIIVSIFVLALKDSASFIHALLHYIPNNPWHQHEVRTRHDHHHIDPLHIHTYLQHKHTHGHDGTHPHTHDVMDHLHADADENENNTASEEIKNTIKIDVYFQSIADLYMRIYSMDQAVPCFLMYDAFIVNRSIQPPCQPPQA